MPCFSEAAQAETNSRGTWRDPGNGWLSALIPHLTTAQGLGLLPGNVPPR